MLNVIKGLLNIAIAIACIIACVFVIKWLIDFNNMNQIETMMYGLDAKINGDGVALFRSFENSATQLIESFKMMIG